MTPFHSGLFHMGEETVLLGAVIVTEESSSVSSQDAVFLSGIVGKDRIAAMVTFRHLDDITSYVVVVYLFLQFHRSSERSPASSNKSYRGFSIIAAGKESSFDKGCERCVLE